MLLGREAECAQIDGLLEGARNGRSAVLILRGEPGVGKSVLLRYATARAPAIGLRTVVARGLESESELPFAALADLLRPIRPELASIPLAQSAVLSGALALGPAIAGDRFAACAAAFSLLAAAAERTPLLAAVDDLQWLDASSAEALLFSARRLGSEGIVLLFAMREGERSALDVADLPSVTLAGLDEAASIRLLTTAGQPVAPAVAGALHRASGGNPLALIEIPALLTEAQRTGVEPLPDPLPAGPQLERAFLRRLAFLPKPTQRALLAAAASESGDTATIWRALELLEVPVAALDAAEIAGLVKIDGFELRFGHPLIRSAIYHAADPVARRQAHRALASALDAEQVADRRAWHLAAAATTPDESVASALEEAAARAQARSGYGAAARALVRSAALSPGQPERARRLMAAASASRLAGHPAEALALLDQAAACQSDSANMFEIDRLRAVIEIWVSKPMVAHERLRAAAAREASTNPGAAAILLAEAALPCFMAGEVSRALETARQARALAEKSEGAAPLLIDIVLAEALALTGDAGAVALVDDAMRRVAMLGPAAAQEAQYLPFSLVALERYAETRMLVAGAVAAARSASAVGILPYALAILSEVDFRTGNFAAAYAGGTESVRLAYDTGQESGGSYSVVTLARVEAAQGRDSDCRAHITRARELARTHGLGSILNYSAAAMGLLELGRGRPKEALLELEDLSRIMKESGADEPNLIQWQPDYIETLARVGRTADALGSLEAFEQQAERTNRAWARATAARCRGYLAEVGFAGHFARALELHEASPSPFEIARTQLCFGETLRRNRQRVEARPMLSEAVETFERLGAEPWANRARAELSATGEKARKRDMAATRDLTPQELQIALAVANGATNREAAAQLFVSPKTVEAHLSSAYRKLGIRSRTELARVFVGDAEAMAGLTWKHAKVSASA